MLKLWLQSLQEFLEAVGIGETIYLRGLNGFWEIKKLSRLIVTWPGLEKVRRRVSRTSIYHDGSNKTTDQGMWGNFKASSWGIMLGYGVSCMAEAISSLHFVCKFLKNCVLIVFTFSFAFSLAWIVTVTVTGTVGQGYKQERGRPRSSCRLKAVSHCAKSCQHVGHFWWWSASCHSSRQPPPKQWLARKLGNRYLK